MPHKNNNHFEGASCEYQMINVAQKRSTCRRAIAQGNIEIGKTAFELVKNKSMPKGDPLLLAEIAGINGAKKVCDQLALCHPIELEQVIVQTELVEEDCSVNVYATVCATAKTGVEMEALAAVHAALLSIYDIVKNVEPALTIKEVRLLVKEGGKSGQWLHPKGVPQQVLDFIKVKSTKPLDEIKASVITVSDRASKGVYEDKSGSLLQSILTSNGADICSYGVVEDCQQAIINTINEMMDSYSPSLVILTGGTGLATRDVTPEAIHALDTKEVPGIGELLRSIGAFYTPYSYISRSIACVYQGALVVALPGNPKAIEQCLPPLIEILPHTLSVVSKD